MKKWIASLFDHQLDLQERSFGVTGLFGLGALFLMSILSTFMGESMTDILLIFIGLGIFFVLFYLTIHFHRIQTGATLIAFMLIFIMLPAIFLSSGGMYGGTPMWFLFAAIYVSLVLRGRRRIFFLAAGGLILIACYAIQWYFPALVIPHTARMAYTDSLASTIIVGFFISLMVIFETNIYIREQKIAKEQRREIEEINRAQNRFFSNMSHEIRTPVNTIIGLNEMIMREAVTVEVAEDARSIQGAGQMLLALINDILDMSKMESGRMELVPNPYFVSEVLKDVVNMIWNPAKEKGLKFHVDVDEMMPRSLIGDDIRIKQILINLLNNAVKYTKEGSVTLTVECRRSTTDIKKVDLICSVADTGIGIKKESLPMLFDVFRRVDEDRNHYIEGTGLGLSIVKQLVELMGGEITVDSVYTKGSTFRVRIPQDIAQDEPLGHLKLDVGKEKSTKEIYRQSFEAPGANVLIVDDNELNRSVAAKLLQATKVHIDKASSGRACLELTQNRHYDVILMDHLMAEMDGIETLQAVRAQMGGMNRETPIIVLTANAGSENQALYRRSGFDGYLLKPVTGAQLESAVLARLPQHLVTLTGIENMQGGEQVFDAYKRKENLIITADSDCDIPDQLLSMHHIEILPYRIHTKEGDFIDRAEVSTGEIMSFFTKGPQEAIRSAAPTVQDYESFFADNLVRADHVFHLTTSAAGEDSYRNATEAAHSFDNVTVYDTGLVSGGIGMMVLIAARMAGAENITPEKLVHALNGARDHVRMTILADTTDRLYSSGRISQRFHNFCRSFMLRPLFTPVIGGMRVRGFVTGPRHQYLPVFVRKALAGGSIDRSRLYVLAPNLLPDEAKKIELLIRKRVDFEEVRILQSSAATSLVWGKDALTFVYLTKS
ncbi:MAG: DegV family protein [Lachnospiraceae bacterium]|nr:DegV family protein [Lachnospiraceae bacterium]